MAKPNKHNHVYASFRNRIDAQTAFDALQQRYGYAADEIHVMMTSSTRDTYYPQDDPNSEDQHPVGSQAAEGGAVGAATGTAIGALAAALTATAGAVLIPGGFVIAGPVAAALAGAGAGGVAGGLLGALVGAGIPESNAKAYEAVLTEGGIVLGVEPREGEDVSEIKDLLEEHKGENVWHG